MDTEILRKTISKDDVSKTLVVKQAKNGFIIEISKSWEEKNDMGEEEYKHSTEYWISKTNPFEKQTKEKENKEPKTISEAIKDLKF